MIKGGGVMTKGGGVLIYRIKILNQLPVARQCRHRIEVNYRPVMIMPLLFCTRGNQLKASEHEIIPSNRLM